MVEAGEIVDFAQVVTQRVVRAVGRSKSSGELLGGKRDETEVLREGSARVSSRDAFECRA
jgi:hypothetical protein